jgi:hypothetical protein
VHVLWPFINWRTGEYERGWRAWPLFGRSVSEGGEHRTWYALWPLIRWATRGDETTRYAFPFYFARRSQKADWDVLLPLFCSRRGESGDRFFLSPLYCSGEDSEASWRMVLPLYFETDNEEGLSRVLLPLYFETHTEQGSSRVLLPVYFEEHTAQGVERMLLPLFWHRRTGEDSLFLSLPYWEGRSADRSWRVVPPLYYENRAGQVLSRLLFPLLYHRRDPEGRLLLTPLLGINRRGEKETVYALPLLSSYARGPEANEVWALFPLMRWRWKDGLEQSHVIPFYYWDREKGLFLSPLWSSRYKGDHRFTNWLVLLAHTFRNPEMSGFSVLLFGMARGTDRLYHGLFPLWFYSRDPDRRHLNVGLPLLDYESGEEGKRLAFLWPFGEVRWAGEETGHRVFPFWSYSRGADRRHLNVGLPLLDYEGSEKGRRLAFLWPFGQVRWAGEETGHRLFPLWSYGRTPQERWLNLALVLARYRSADGIKKLHVLGPLAGGRWDEEGYRHHAWPFYSAARTERERKLILGPTLGDLWLLGTHRLDETVRNRAFPLSWGRSLQQEHRDGAPGDESVRVRRSWFTAFPFVYAWSEAPMVDHEPEGPDGAEPPRDSAPEPMPRRSLTVLALFHHARTGDPDSAESPRGRRWFWFLGPLFDSLKEVTPAEGEPGETDLYVRRRILWRVMHYERVNDETSLDLFPGITYDTGPGRKTFSLLWRVFRYERRPDAPSKYHVLFIPFGGG